MDWCKWKKKGTSEGITAQRERDEKWEKERDQRTPSGEHTRWAHKSRKTRFCRARRRVSRKSVSVRWKNTHTSTKVNLLFFSAHFQRAKRYDRFSILREKLNVSVENQSHRNISRQQFERICKSTESRSTPTSTRTQFYFARFACRFSSFCTAGVWRWHRACISSMNMLCAAHRRKYIHLARIFLLTGSQATARSPAVVVALRTRCDDMFRFMCISV